MARLLVFSLLCLSALSAYADEAPIFDTSVAGGSHKVLIMVMPDMASKVVAGVSLGGSIPNVGAETIGVRGQVFAYKNRNLALTFEGFAAGYAVGSTGLFDMANAFGGGFRVELPLVSDGDNDALMVAPGVDIMYVQKGTNQGGWFAGNLPYTDIYFIGTNVDVAWLHMFAHHFGIQLGAQAGADVSLGGTDGYHQETRGKVYPKLTMFGGFVF